jgi:hypothetical protein
VGNLVAYGMSCGSSAGGCSATGALVSAGAGAVGGAVGGALIGPLGGRLASSVLGDVLPEVAVRGLAGATAGAAAGAAGGAAGYAGGCAQGAACSWSGLGSAATGGAAAGAIMGGIGGAISPSLSRRAAASCGGMSFTANTKVVTAKSGALAISKLKKGQKVLATNIKTGKTAAEPVAAVLVHHDTNLYNLKVRVGDRTAIIGTTSNHPFWDVTASRWVKAGALKYGAHLRTPDGGTALVAGGYVPRNDSGPMWDLMVMGDHDFYVSAFVHASTGAHGDTKSLIANEIPVLVHNCSTGQIPYNSDELSSAAYQARGPAGIGPGANVATAKLPGWNSPTTGDIVIGFSKGSGYHAEDDILEQVAARGIDPNQITGLYSERQPCPTCAPLLGRVLKRGAPISWSVPWGDNPIVNRASNRVLARMIERAGG